MPIKNWSTTPLSNSSSPPNGWPEGMAPSAVNDTARQQMADHRTQWENAEWFDWGDTPSRASATTFKITGDVTARYLKNRRVKLYDTSTLYATVTAVSYSNPDTTVTIELDSGATSASLTSVALAILTPTNLSVPSTIGRKGSDIASASTTDLSAGTGDFVDVTGTTTITALGTVAAGVEKTVRFTGALTLTHNGTSLIIPGAVNITTANGDIARFRSLGSGNWVCVLYVPASGRNVIIGFKGADIASASTVDLSAATGDFVDITGTTTITAFGTATAGIQRTVRFTGALTLTYNATSLILPGSANITTANGDMAIFRSLGSGNWQCVVYTKRDGTPNPFIDSNPFVVGSSDATKKLRTEVDGISTATTRVWTAPDRDIDIGKSTAYEFISTITASSSATVDFTSLSLSTYKAIRIIGHDIVSASDAVSFYMRISVSGTFQANASDYIYAGFGHNSGLGNNVDGSGAGAAQVLLNRAGELLGNNTDEKISFEATWYDLSNTSNKKFGWVETFIKSSTANYLSGRAGYAYIGANSAVDGVRFLMSSGNIASGKFHLYGIRNAA